MTTPSQSIKIYPNQFWLVCCSSLLFFASFNMIIPELPAYLTSLGGAEYKGLIISLFTITAMVSRPFSGKLADRLGRRPVMMVGSMVCFVISLMYPLLTTVAGFLLLRLIHGFSTGFTPTGQTAYLADVIPPQKRGEAMGILGTAGTVGMAIGPALGSNIANIASLNYVFYCSSLFALLSVVIIINVRETLTHRNNFHVNMFKVERRDLFDVQVWRPCFVMFFSAYCYGTMLTIIPDFGDHVGFQNKGWLFTFFTIASLMVRFFGGKASDRFGRVSVLSFSIPLIIIAMMLIAIAKAPFLLAAGMTLYGIGHGLTAPSLLAWTADLGDQTHRARGLASIYIFMELGIGTGALASGILFGNNPANFFLVFITSSLLTAIAFIFLMTQRGVKF